MLKLKKNKSEAGGGGQAASSNAQGISAGANALQRLWVIALLVTLVPIVLGFSYLLVLRESSTQQQQVLQVSDQISREHAARVELLFDRLNQRLAAAASSPLVLAAIGSGDPSDLPLIEKAMLDYFPSATSVRLLKLDEQGLARKEASNLGLRNHIELDLLRRALSGENSEPESYQFEGKWLTSLAWRVTHPRTGTRNAVILATFNNSIMNQALAVGNEGLGRSMLQQLYKKGNFSRADEIAAHGSGDMTEFSTRTELNQGLWVVEFTPSSALVASIHVNILPLIIVAVVILLSALGAMTILYSRWQKTLAKEVELMGSMADSRTEVETTIPALVPIARQLRILAQRTVKRQAGAQRAVTGNTDASADITDPLFQNTKMIDEDDASDDSISKPEDIPAEVPPASEGLTPAHIFRAYDIRGIAATELTGETVGLIGKAIGTLTSEAGQQSLVVACDGRNSSPELKNILVKAMLSTGVDVIDIGTVPTPLLYFATHTLDTRSGVMVTGSHNPAQYNGFKIVIDGKVLSGDSIQELRARAEKGKFASGSGRLAKQQVTDSYIDKIVADAAIAVPLKIVVDAGNGVGGLVAPALLEELGCEVTPLYCDVDGNFPNHHPDPSDEDNLKDLCEMVIAREADFGIALDGDADRLAVVSSRGEIIRNDRLLAIFAQDVVSRNPGADVIFDVKCSRHLNALISRCGGRPILWKTGHSFMREKMQETGAALGGEFSGHIFFGERWYGFDDGIYAAARLAEIVSSSSEGLEPLLTDFPVTQSTPEIRIPVHEEEKFGLVEQLTREGSWGNGKLNTLDGARVDFPDGWGLVRASNTTPALTARFEGDNTEALERIKTVFREQLAAVDPALNPGF